MSNTFQKGILVSSLFVVVAISGMPKRTHADEFEDAIAAYQSGDYETAFGKLEPLAKKGHLFAQGLLGELYREGQGVRKDAIQAYAWLHVATAQEDDHWPLATGSRRSLEVTMTIDQVIEARELAKKYAKGIHPELVKLMKNAESEESNKTIFEAIYDGYGFRIKELLESGIDVNTRNDDGATPLVEALRYFRYDIVRILLAQGAEVNVTDSKHNTPLIIATTHALDLEIVESLLDKGADANTVNDKGDTPLSNITKWADHFRYGDGNWPKDINLAIQWYQLAASLGDAHSRKALAEIEQGD